jgi:hypothetical protein
MKRKIVTVITAVSGDRVIVCKDELDHALRHFTLPEDIFLELLERVLKDPSEVYVDNLSAPHVYHLFYRLESGRYLLAVVKLLDDGNYLASMYPTGKNIRALHKKMKRLKV